MAHIMNELPDVKVRLRAEPADEFSARVLGALAPGAFEPGDGLALRLPAYMGTENAVQVTPVRGAWEEVFPGLQAQLRNVSQGLATIEFRLTPPDGQARD